MNDPGLQDPIQNGAETVEHGKDDEPRLEEEEEQAFLNPRSVIQTKLALSSPCSNGNAVDGGSLQQRFP